MMQHLQGRRIWILGLGISGLAMARWCIEQGAASVTAWDSRPDAPGWIELEQALPQAIKMLELPRGSELQEQLQDVH